MKFGLGESDIVELSQNIRRAQSRIMTVVEVRSAGCNAMVVVARTVRP